MRQLAGRPDNAHPASSPARRSLHDDRIPCALGLFQRHRFRSNDFGAGKNRQAQLRHRPARLVLIPHHPHGLWTGTYEGQVGGLANLGEVSAFRQEPVSRMNRLGAGDFCSGNDARHVEVTVRAAGRADAHGLVRKAHVKRVPVGFGIDRHRLNPQLLAGADYPQGDFTAIGNQDLLKHGGPRTPKLEIRNSKIEIRNSELETSASLG